MSVNLNASIFREYDVRGIAGKDLTAPFANLLGRAYAELLEPGKTVAVGRDCRLTGDEYANALADGLRSAGLNVILLGVCPTPLTYFSSFHLGVDGAIMVTGSHNPSNYNGFKICLGKDTLHGASIQDLRVRMERLNQSPAKTSAKPGTLQHYEIIPPYLDHLVKNARPVKPLKIVVDAGNGTAATVAPLLFERLGAKVIPLFCTLDGRFPNHHPDPTVLANLKDLIDTVRKERADFGVAFDGDSDRIGLVDENGSVIYGDEMMVLFARDILREHPGATVISEVKSSHRLYQDVEKHGGKAVMWKTGHSLIKSKMKESGALLAGEMSGHMFFADRYFGYDDAIYAALRVFEIASREARPMSRLLADLPKSVTTPEIRIDCEEALKFELVEQTKRAVRASGATLNDIDGIRVEHGDGWGLLRASNTQPVLVMRFEAQTQSRLSEIQTMMEAAVSKAASQIGHPPLRFDVPGGH